MLDQNSPDYPRQKRLVKLEAEIGVLSRAIAAKHFSERMKNQFRQDREKRFREFKDLTGQSWEQYQKEKKEIREKFYGSQD